MKAKRWRLSDPVSLGFQMLIQTEKRMVRWRTFKVKARLAVTMGIIVVAQIGCLVGLMALLTWVQGVA